MSLFANKIASAKPSEGGVYLLKGNYLLQIDVNKAKLGRRNQELYIAEVDILESSNPERPAGSHASWVASSEHESAAGDVKSYLAAVAGVPADAVDAAGVDASTSAENPLGGRLVRCEVVEKPTKKGGIFSKHYFHAVPEEFQAQAAALRQQAGLPPRGK